MTKSCKRCQAVRNPPPAAPPSVELPITSVAKDTSRLCWSFLWQNVFVIVDAHSKWAEVIEMKSTIAAATITQ